MYVFGRYQYRRQINASGEVRKQMHPVSMADWRVSLQEHHDGYINWGEYLKNQERLEKNRTNGGEMILSGPAREGLALLQGLLVCGQCGRALTVRYTGNGGIYPCYQCNSLHRDGLASKGCMSFRCDLLDVAIAKEVLQALQPAELELALAALEELEARDHTIGRQWQMRLERAEYEAALAERRYQEVDPFAAIGRSHTGTALEYRAASLRGTQTTGRGVSTPASASCYPGAKSESPRPGQ
jgi:hypothetical protein